MPRSWLIAILAGLISAVVMVSAGAGPTGLRFLLFAVTPLPIALVGLGWGWRSGAVAGTAGTIFILLVSGQVGLAAIFALTQAVPMAGLVYLAGLSRPADEANPGITPAGQNTSVAQLEWYPVGRIILWAVGIGAAIAVGLIVLFGAFDPNFMADLENKLSEAIKANISSIAGNTELKDTDVATMTKVAIAMLPAGGAIAIAGSLLLCLWVAARIAQASDNLERPWPDLAAFDYPTGTALTLAAALAVVSFAPPPLTMVGSAVVGALLFAFLLLGLAVVHYITRGNAWRPFALWALYIGLLFLQGFALLVILLGLFEAFLNLRAKFGGPSQPPPTTPNQHT